MTRNTLLGAASALTLVLAAAPAMAQTTAPAAGVLVSPDFPAHMYETPPTSLDDGSGTICLAPNAVAPYVGSYARLNNIYCGFVSKANVFQYDNWNPSAGTYLFTPIGKALDYFKTNGVKTMLSTLRNVEPSPITFDSTVPANVTAVDTRTRALMNYAVARGTPFGIIQPGNEWGDTTNYWASANTFTDAAVLYCTQAQAVQETSPATDIAEVGWTPTSNGQLSGSAPSAWAYSLDMTNAAITAKCPTRLWKWADMHGYPSVLAGTMAVPSRPWDLYSDLNTFVALHKARGYPIGKLMISEAFIRGNRSYNNLTAAGDQAAEMILAASYYNSGVQVRVYMPESLSWRQTNTVYQVQDSYTLIGTAGDGLNATGRMLRFWANVLPNGRFITPMKRSVGTNLIRAPLTSASGYTSGKISGPGTNCPADVPSGTAVTPTGVGFFNQGSAAGMSQYINAPTQDTDGTWYAEIIGCGQDTTAGASVHEYQYQFESSIAVAASTEYIAGINLAMSGGDMTNIQTVELKIDDQSFNDFVTRQFTYPVNYSVAANRQEASFKTKGTTTTIHGQVRVAYYYNGTTPKQVYFKLRVALPSIEAVGTGVVISGVFQDPKGLKHCIAWVNGDENNGASWTPPAACSTHTHWTDGVTGDHVFTAGSALTLANVPIYTGDNAS